MFSNSSPIIFHKAISFYIQIIKFLLKIFVFHIFPPEGNFDWRQGWCVCVWEGGDHLGPQIRPNHNKSLNMCFFNIVFSWKGTVTDAGDFFWEITYFLKYRFNIYFIRYYLFCIIYFYIFIYIYIMYYRTTTTAGHDGTQRANTSTYTFLKNTFRTKIVHTFGHCCKTMFKHIFKIWSYIQKNTTNPIIALKINNNLYYKTHQQHQHTFPTAPKCISQRTDLFETIEHFKIHFFHKT